MLKGVKDMMWKEFEQAAGYEVTYEDYTNYIEPMYMALCSWGGGVTKREFAKMVSRERFALPSPEAILRKIRRDARMLRRCCLADHDHSIEERLYKEARQYAERKYGISFDTDRSAYCTIMDAYEYPKWHEGRYPDVMVIGRGDMELCRIRLQKN